MTAQTTLAQALILSNGTRIKNRLFKSAMSEALARRDGAPSPELVRLYSAWAGGGIGLCVTGNVMIDARAVGEPGNVVIEDNTHLVELQSWAQAATANNTQCWVQLNHPGKQAPKGLNRETVAPSAVPFRSDLKAFFATPRALEDSEVRALIQRYGVAAGVVKQAGFSGVQIHGAHGYLVSQFLSPHHNTRTDAWGGTAQKRRHFVLEVYRAMREAVGPAFPIGIKLNSADFQRGGFTEEESIETIRALADVGIDLIEISGGTYEAPAMTGVQNKTQLDKNCLLYTSPSPRD
jgi:2,4-dienoyl-CoA reductase-like NADH-dependent reductase (Old Yellow Enzyme family)